MNQHDRDVVDAIGRQLAERVGADRYGLWFVDGVRLSRRENTLQISAADSFRLDRLRRFQVEIAEAAEQVLGQPIELRFAVDAGLQVEPPDETNGSPAASSGAKSTGKRGSRRGKSSEAKGAGESQEAGESQGAGGTKGRASNRRGGQSRQDGEADRGKRTDGASNVKKKPVGFRTFVEGDGNRVALTAARSTLRRLGRVSPLLVYGPSGTGKSHLLECLRAEARAAAPRRRIVSLSAEQFTSAFLEALQGSGLPSFRRKYRDVELLLIDDVQFFRGKRATLVELQHTIDGLQRSGGQLVLATDRPPGERSGFGPELNNRLTGGLVCRIDPPDYATRLAILKQMAADYEVDFPADVLAYLAEQLPGDARQLRGALNRLEASGMALQRALNVQLAATLLDDIFRATRPIVRLNDIDRAVCEVFGLDSNTLQSNRKARHVSHPRMLAMFLARKHTRSALSEIGDYFGNRTHSTVISAQKKVQRWMVSSTGVRMLHGECSVEDAIRQVEIRLGTA